MSILRQSSIESVQNGSVSIKQIQKGSNIVFRKKVLTSGSQVYNTGGSTNTFTLPSYLQSLTITVIGGGGGGANSTFYHGNKWTGRAGGSGAVCKSVFTESSATSLSGTQLTCVVGAAGTAMGGSQAGGPCSSGGQMGGNGGTSTCSGTNISMSATGGTGGMSGWYNNGHAAAGGTASGGNSLNKSGYAAPYNSSNVFASTPSAWDDTTTGYGAGGWQEGYGATIHAGVVGAIILEYTYLKPIG